MKRFLLLTAAVLAFTGCEKESGPTEPGTAFELAARPEVWRVLPRSPAEEAGLQPGDVMLLYDGIPVRSNEDVRAAQEQAAGKEKVPVMVLRGDEEIQLELAAGRLGVMPVSARYPSSLALALEDLMRNLGLFTDYDWLAALSGESFTFTAHEDVCRAWWPGGKSGVYLEDLAGAAGLALHPLGDGTIPTADAVRAALARGDAVLLEGGWSDYRADFWGVASRSDGPQGTIYGYTLDSAEELPVTGTIRAAYAVEREGAWVDPVDMLATVLEQGLELIQVVSDTGWKSGIEAYDLLVADLDTTPFCPVCGAAESQACFDRVVWVTIAHKESQVRFLEAMKLALPDQVALLDEAIGDVRAALGKFEGITRSGARVAVPADREKLKVVIAEIEVIENDLIGVYEEILAGL